MSQFFDNSGTGSYIFLRPSPASFATTYNIFIPSNIGSDDTVVLQNFTQAMTNKTITDHTNTVRATQLATTTADVVLSAGTAPIANQVLIATSPTAATWSFIPLSGDVTGTQNATVVSFVGGSSAANVNSATVLALAATPLDTVSTIVKRDGSGNFAAGTITANDFTAVNAAASTQSFNASVTGDLVARYNVATDGTTSWSSGAVASDVREYRSAVNTLTIDNGTIAGPAHLEVAGNERVGGYLKVGALTAPLNTTAGDITGTRAMIGSTDTTFNGLAGRFMIVDGVDTTNGASSSNAIGLIPTFTPGATLSGTATGTLLAALSTGSNQITGSIIGASSQVQSFGSGNITSATGMKTQAINATGSSNTPTVSTGNGMVVADSTLGSGPVALTTQYGVNIAALNAASSNNTGILVNAFTGTATTNIGIDVNAFTSSGTRNVGLRIAAPSGATNNYALQLSTQSTTAAGGILLGSGADTTLANLYRTAAGKSRTDGEFQAQHFLCVSGTPSIAVGAGAGSTGSVSFNGTPTDAGMQVSVTVSGSLAGAANAIIFLVTFAVPYTSLTQYVTFSAANAAAASIAVTKKPYVSITLSNQFAFTSNASALALGTYNWNFIVSG
jgi:hypothetical protein